LRILLTHLIVIGLALSCHSVTSTTVDVVQKDSSGIPDGVVVLDQSNPTESPLVDHMLWVLTDPDLDPLASHRPTEISCPPGAYGEEQGTFEVETGYCNYISMSQPSLMAIASGNKIHVTLWHNNLVAAEPYEAHVAIFVGDQLIWESQVSVPHDAAVYDTSIPVNFSAAAGTPVHYHLHNHGYNSWNLLYVNVVP
jgi:hypothetical protein